MNETERSPLLRDTVATPSAPSLLPPAYDSLQQQASGITVTGHVSVDELPPPYMPSGLSGVPMISCKVCQAPISLDGKISQLVVKCNSCSEATPIRAAPPGKKYVRCQCNCLLICKTEARRVACPRETCKKIIILHIEVVPEVHTPGYCRVVCGHCNGIFLFNIITRALAICPHCRKVSSVGKWFARSRGVAFIIPAICFLLFAIILTCFTHDTVHTHHGVVAGYVCIFVVAAVLFWRAFHYLCMAISQVEGPA